MRNYRDCGSCMYIDCYAFPCPCANCIQIGVTLPSHWMQCRPEQALRRREKMITAKKPMEEWKWYDIANWLMNKGVKLFHRSMPRGGTYPISLYIKDKYVSFGKKDKPATLQDWQDACRTWCKGTNTEVPWMEPHDWKEEVQAVLESTSSTKTVREMMMNIHEAIMIVTGKLDSHIKEGKD